MPPVESSSNPSGERRVASTLILWVLLYFNGYFYTLQTLTEETYLRSQSGSTDSMVGLPSENVSVPKFMIESQS